MSLNEKIALLGPGPIYLAERVDDLPAPYVSSSRRSCSQCGDYVWVELRSRALADHATIVCRPCMKETVK